MKTILLYDNDFGERTGKFFYTERILNHLNGRGVKCVQIVAEKNLRWLLFSLIVPRILLYTLRSQFKVVKELKNSDLVIVDHLRNSLIPVLLRKEVVLIQHNIEHENLMTMRASGIKSVIFVIEAVRLRIYERWVMSRARKIAFISNDDLDKWGREGDFWLPPHFEIE